MDLALITAPAIKAKYRFTIGSILVIALIGCGSAVAPIPTQPNAPTDGGIVAKVGKDIDKTDSRVAAAITVANESADKPTVVKAETAVALSYLPAPSLPDLLFARQRASTGTAEDYKSAIDAGRKLLAKVDSAWATMEADQREAARVSKLKDDRIASLVAEVEQVKRDGVRNYCLMAAGFCGLVALVLSLVGQYMRAGIAGLFALGCASTPFLLESDWFIPGIGGFVFLALILAGFHIFRKPPTPLCDVEKKG